MYGDPIARIACRMQIGCLENKYSTEWWYGDGINDMLETGENIAEAGMNFANTVFREFYDPIESDEYGDYGNEY